MPEIRSMTSKFANTCLYGTHHRWGVHEFCTPFGCTEEEVETQFRRLWKNANDFRERWAMLMKNTERKTMKNKRRRQNRSSNLRKTIVRGKSVTTEGATAIATDGMQELAPTPATFTNQETEQLILKAAEVRAEIDELKLAFQDKKAAMEQLKQEMLDTVNAGTELVLQLDELNAAITQAQSYIEIHVDENGFIEINSKEIDMNREQIEARASGIVAELLRDYDFGELDMIGVYRVKRVVAKCFYAEEQLAEQGKKVTFIFANEALHARPYEYARKAQLSV